MVEVSIEPVMISNAQKEAKALGQLNNSITKGEGNVYGFLGEMVVARYIGAKIERTYQYDLIKSDVRFDVKTKHCTSKPLLTYFCTVADYNTGQQCDYYTFVRVLKDFSTAWILGSISKKRFFNEAIFYKKGQLDPNSDLGWFFKADCYNLPISKLTPFKNMINGSDP